MWYGFTKKAIFQGLINFIGIGVFAVIMSVMMAQFLKPEHPNYWYLLLLFIFFPGLWLVLGFLFSITWFKINSDQIEYHLWKKIHLCSCPIKEVTHIGSDFFSAYFIKTKKVKIRLFAIDKKDRKNLSDYLIKINPNIQMK